MADERKIVIELIASGGDEDEDEDKETNEEKEAKQKRKKIKSAVFSLVSTAIKEVENQVFYDLEKYTSLSDDYKTAILIDNVKTTVNKVVGLGKSVVSWAKTGAIIGGPVGAIIGATIGAGINITSESLSLSRQYQTQSLNLYLADKEAKYARTRLGLIDNGRGTQN